MRNLFRKPTSPSTVSEILGTLSTQLQQLSELQQVRINRASSNRTMAADLLDEADSHEEEANRAGRVLKRFEELLG